MQIVPNENRCRAKQCEVVVVLGRIVDADEAGSLVVDKERNGEQTVDALPRQDFIGGRVVRHIILERADAHMPVNLKLRHPAGDILHRYILQGINLCNGGVVAPLENVAKGIFAWMELENIDAVALIILRDDRHYLVDGILGFIMCIERFDTAHQRLLGAQFHLEGRDFFIVIGNVKGDFHAHRSPIDRNKGIGQRKVAAEQRIVVLPLHALAQAKLAVGAKLARSIFALQNGVTLFAQILGIRGATKGILDVFVDVQKLVRLRIRDVA